MENEIQNKTGIISKLTNIIIERKRILISILILITIFLIGLKFFDYYKEKKNKEIAEKYIKAGIYLSSNKKDQSKEIYKEIINSKNKFYSILALNTILEKDLISEKQKLLSYFDLVEGINLSDDQKDLLSFKKALYFLKYKQDKEGIKILNNLIKKNSEFKSLAEKLVIE